MQDLLRDIAAHAALDGSKLKPIKYEETNLPVEAYWGTLYLRSEAGTLLEFYSYFDPDFKTIPHYPGWNQKIIQTRFHKLERVDKIYFKKFEDFEMYDTEIFHRLLSFLHKNGFTLLRV